MTSPSHLPSISISLPTIPIPPLPSQRSHSSLRRYVSKFANPQKVPVRAKQGKSARDPWHAHFASPHQRAHASNTRTRTTMVMIMPLFYLSQPYAKSTWMLQNQAHSYIGFMHSFIINRLAHLHHQNIMKLITLAKTTFLQTLPTAYVHWNLRDCFIR